MSRHSARPGKEFWLATLRHDGPLLDAAAAGPGALDTPLPDRIGFTVGDLLGDLGAEYRWVCGHLPRGVTDHPDRTAPQPPTSALLDWWRDASRQLLTTLDAVDADLPAWNWAPQPKRAGFWHRRMAHRTALDRWDVQVAAGTTEPLEAKSASDGIAELLDTVLAAAGSRPHEPTGTVRLIAADTGYEWLVRLRTEGMALLDITGHRIPGVRAVAAGTASDLLLALTGRVGFDLMNTAGDERLLTQLIPKPDPRPAAAPA